MGKRKLRFDKDLVSYKRRKVGGTSTNPFDKRFQKVKKRVLGKAIKGTQKREGQSRSSDLKQRKTAFAKAQKSKRANTFQDRRYDKNFDRALQEKVGREKEALVRFQRQRMKLSKKSFSLEDGESVELTHKGQTLSKKTLADFEAPEKDDDDSDFDLEELEKSEPMGFSEVRKRAGLPEPGQPRTAKQAMQEIVLKSRFLKEIRRKEKETLQENMDAVDVDFQKIKAALLDYSGGKKDKKRKEKPDDFDKLVGALRKEKKLEGTTRLKSAEERAKEERENLEAQEKARVKRQNEAEVGDLDILNWDQIEEEAQQSRAESAKLIELEAAAPSKARSTLRKTDISDMPFILEVPQGLEEFQDMLAGQETKDQLEIIQRIRKSNHVRLKAENQQQIQKFYGFLLEHFKQLCHEERLSLRDIDVMARAIFALSHDIPEIAAGVARGNLIKIQKKLEDKNTMPTGYLLMYFKLLTNVFPMSDYNHPIASSLQLLFAFCLSRCRVRTAQQAAAGLYVCILLLHTVRESKRYVPELVAFLQHLLQVGILEDSSFLGFGFELMKQESPVFWQFSVGSNIWKKLGKDSEGSLKMDIHAVMHPDVPDQELSCFHTVLTLLREATSLWRELPTFQETAQEFLQLLKPYGDRIPESCEGAYRETCELLGTSFARHRQPMFVRLRPKTIQSLEPEYDPEFFPDMEKSEEHYRKLIRAEKKKEKDAKKQTMRDLRKNAEFAVRQTRELRADDERRKKEAQKALWAFQEKLQADSNVMDRIRKK